MNINNGIAVLKFEADVYDNHVAVALQLKEFLRKHHGRAVIKPLQDKVGTAFIDAADVVHMRRSGDNLVIGLTARKRSVKVGSGEMQSYENATNYQVSISCKGAAPAGRVDYTIAAEQIDVAISSWQKNGEVLRNLDYRALLDEYHDIATKIVAFHEMAPARVREKLDLKFINVNIVRSEIQSVIDE